jgi:hypothetical protein
VEARRMFEEELDEEEKDWLIPGESDNPEK